MTEQDVAIIQKQLLICTFNSFNITIITSHALQMAAKRLLLTGKE